MLVAVILASCTATPGASPSASERASSVPTPTPTLANPDPVTLVVDTDVAADDLVAIAFLVSAPNVEIVAITVTGTGEAHCGPGVDVVLRLLERLAAPDIPVTCGLETPLEGSKAFPDEWRQAVDNGAGLTLPETDRQPFHGTAIDLLNQVLAEDGSVEILTLGPLTNLGDALNSDPALAERIARITVMGGALYVPGNIGDGENEVSEWNVYVDPRALEIVIAAGLAPDLVSLDGTNQVPVTPAFGRMVAEEATEPGALVLADLFAANPWMTAGDYYLWDPLAAMLAAGHPVGTFESDCVAMEMTDGPEWGFTRPADCDPNVTYLAEANASLAEATLFGILNAP